MNMKVTFIGEDKGLGKEYDKLLKKQVKLEEQNAKLAAKSQQAHQKATNAQKSQNTLAGRGIRQIAQLAAGWFSVSQAVQLVNTKIQQQIELEDKLKNKQLDVGAATAGLVINLGDISRRKAQQSVKEVKQLATAGGFENTAAVLAAAGSIQSGVGDFNITKNVLREILPFGKANPEELPAIGGAVADLAKITGSQTQADVKRNLAVVLQTQQFARITGIEAFKNAAPGIGALANADSSGDRFRAIRQGGAAFAAIGQGIFDPDGALTKTAEAKLAAKLERLLPEKDFIGLDGKVVRQGTGLQTFAQRRQAVLGDVNLQREFFQGSKTFERASFRGPIQSVIEKFLKDPDSVPSRRFDTALKGITGAPGIVGRLRENLIGASTESSLFEFNQQTGAKARAADLSDPRGFEGSIREKVNETLIKTRTDSFIGGIIEEKVGAFTERSNLRLPFTKARTETEQQLGRLGSRINEIITFNTPGFGGEAGQRAGSLTGEEREDVIAGLSDKQRGDVRLLQELMADIKAESIKQTQLMQQIKDGQTRPVGPEAQLQRGVHAE